MAKSPSSIMKQRILLQERALTENAYGEKVESWNDLTFLNASFEPLKGQEFFKRNDLPQKIAQVDTRIRIRYRKGLNPAEHRIIYGGAVHDIVAVIHDRRNGQTQLMVKSADGGANV